MVRNGKKPENPLNLLVAATLEKAITYVLPRVRFAMRRPGVRPSSAPPNKLNPSATHPHQATSALKPWLNLTIAVTWHSTKTGKSLAVLMKTLALIPGDDFKFSHQPPAAS